MKRKIVYCFLMAVVGVAAFFVGKNSRQPNLTAENLKLTEVTAESNGLYLEYTDGNIFQNVWIPAEKLEHAGLINTENIIDWNTDGKELAVMTENGYEWYAQQTEEVYKNRLFVSVGTEGK